MIVMLQKFQLIPIKTECARAVPVGYLPLAEHAKERTFLRGGLPLSNPIHSFWDKPTPNLKTPVESSVNEVIFRHSTHPNLSSLHVQNQIRNKKKGEREECIFQVR